MPPSPTTTRNTHTHIPHLQTLTIPFQVPHRTQSTATITISPCTDPELHGIDLLNLYTSPSCTKGYPILKATISSPESQTYASLYGWIQTTITPGEDWTMDLYPPFQNVNSPFIIWGAEPTLVDAPGRENVREYEWTARSWLCYSPDAAMTRTVVPVLGVEWGFWIQEGRPYVKELRRVELREWDGTLGLLRGRFEGWEFREVGE